MLFFRAVFLLSFVIIAGNSMAQTGPAAVSDTPMSCGPTHETLNALLPPEQQRFGRTVCADIVAMDQMLVYNRFGSFNPFGMIYALRRDVVGVNKKVDALNADACDKLDGTEGYGKGLTPGEVRLKDCKRPRPLTLRANAGDVLHVRLTNLLRPLQTHKPGEDAAPDFSRDFCDAPNSDGGYGSFFHRIRNWVSSGDRTQSDHREVACGPEGHRPPLVPDAPQDGPDWPTSRGANMAIQGLTAFAIVNDQMAEAPDACKGLGAIPPGASVDCFYLVEREGPYFMASTGAPAGGEGDGGSITHGLFGAVMAERTGSRWYRSQVSRAAFNAVFTPKDGDDLSDHARVPETLSGIAPYETTKNGVPVLNMLRTVGGDSYEIVHSDLNAVVYLPDAPEKSFREFSVFLHDELKTFYPRAFEELGAFGEGQLAGVRDGFAINYGASGMGDMLLANRKGIGPAANCAECLYEEFFLTSWANGDPALLEQFSDDPSNVHHSYLNDPIVFRNFHAGPKETHVFHLHAHQWFAGNDGGRGAYLDSQTVAPQQGFSYDIYQGGMEVYHKGNGGAPGWFETLGSGNRNRTVGDSIFHCHLYPHFAQGMWELWRVHDVLEDGTRKLPDGQWEPALSLAEMNRDTRGKKRPGSVDPETGDWIEPGAGLQRRNLGTPVPAIVPVPGHAWPVLPSYATRKTLGADGKLAAAATPDANTAITEDETPTADFKPFPGYPFYIAGQPGHRPPQAPMDIARALTEDKTQVTADYLDGGLPRHVMGDGSKRKLPFDLPKDTATRLAKDTASATLKAALNDTSLRHREALQSQILAAALALGDMTMELEAAEITPLPYDGTDLERAAMAFHHKGVADGTDLAIRSADGAPSYYDTHEGGYASLGGLTFAVNGAPPKPGAPFADPCGAPDSFARLTRVASGGYTWRDATGEHPVFTDEALSVAATDAEVSNWVQFRRSAAHRKPDLYVEDKDGQGYKIPRDALIEEADPFVAPATDVTVDTTTFATDPAVVGYRRYEASAVQVDMVTNRAGWHDPQARINVLTERSDTFKTGDGKISPRVSASEEPFFFRALSGECIEFRHTNELPKDLELDDFQVRTPTDTIGQHIHLVKFDVTSSDGSGNGFNYEDGTLAPDEIAARICAAKNTKSVAMVTKRRQPGELLIREYADLCEQVDGHWRVAEKYAHKIWKLPLHDGKNRDLFQTTTQRWFADPILSNLRLDKPGEGQVDRTLRTVFSHDHFGPSSIQQHGFYTALLIEPQNALICAEEDVDCTDARTDRRLALAGPKDVGARKVIVDLFPITADLPAPEKAAALREFAVSIADFATLYDPRAGITPDEFDAQMESTDTDVIAASRKGMAMLLCEARYAASPEDMEKFCGSELTQDKDGHWLAKAPGNLPPAWLSEGRPGDIAPDHQLGFEPTLFSAGITIDGKSPEEHLDHHLKTYRAQAAGYAGYKDADQPTALLARPVSAPLRPESISVDHHDPYLVNYRGQPFPIRIGTDSSASPGCDLHPLGYWVGALASGVTDRCEISRQKDGAEGDMANVLVSALHGDPVVPILNVFDGDTIQFRLIQGAQEVQHTFNVEGYSWPRNIDQAFPSMMRLHDNVTPRDTLLSGCYNSPGSSGLRMARAGRPDEYGTWANADHTSFPVNSDAYLFWRDLERQIADCINTDGRIAAQEIGISEHFEFRSAFFYDTNISGVNAFRMLSREEEAPLPPVGSETAIEALKDRIAELQAYGLSDTPYHFGSQDALWNGAWGLLRIRDAADRLTKRDDLVRGIEGLIAEIEQSCVAPCALTGDLLQRYRALTEPDIDTLLGARSEAARLAYEVPLAIDADPAFPDPIQQPEWIHTLASYTADAATRNASRALRSRLPANRTAFAVPAEDGAPAAAPPLVAKCAPDAPRVYAAIAAVEASVAFPDKPAGTPYADGLYDIDGLFFALLDPRRVISDDPATVSELDIDVFASPSKWQDIPRSRILEAIADTYAQPEPLVLNVKAGDCVRLTVINALTSHDDGQTPPRQDMTDHPGDAEMPGITSINTDPAWDGDTRPGHGVPVKATMIESTRDIHPSARLAVTLPLPVVTRQDSYGRPFGQNPLSALDGVPEDGTVLHLRNGTSPAQIEQIEFYAGLAFGKRAASAAAAESLLLSSDAPAGVLQLPAFATAGGATETLGDFAARAQAERLQLGEALRTEIDRIGTPRTGLAQPGDVEKARSALAPALDQLRPGDPALPGTDDLSALDRSLTQALTTRALTAAQTEQILQAIEPQRAQMARTDLVAMAKAATLGLDASYKPYAFGALPIKSFGDVIGHPTHGLIGAVTVAPQHAELSEERVQRLPFGLAGCDALVLAPNGLPIARTSRIEDYLGTARGQLRSQAPAAWQGLPQDCASFALVPRSTSDSARKSVPIAQTLMTVTAPFGTPAREHKVRQVTLFWQDGLNHRDIGSANDWKTPAPEKIVADCMICDDSYDFGDKGVSYQSEPFDIRLRDWQGNRAGIERHYNFNAFEFGATGVPGDTSASFFRLAGDESPLWPKSPMPVLRALAGEELVIHVVHPGGRARQQSFVTVGLDYDDLFPGFGFPRGALLAPGKAVTAAMSKPLEAGCYLFFDGPTQIRAGGVWGLIDVVAPEALAGAALPDAQVSSCVRGLP